MSFIHKVDKSSTSLLKNAAANSAALASCRVIEAMLINRNAGSQIRVLNSSLRFSTKQTSDP